MSKEKDSSIVKINNLNFSFGSVKVLDDITFDIVSGDFLGIIGSNGSGKTTLLKAILGLYDIPRDKIELFGTDRNDFHDFSRLGYVPQKATGMIDNNLATVYDVVSFGLLSKKKFPKIINSKDKTEIISALKEVGMEKFSGRKIKELSGGQQQRVFIAKAIASKPEILFLDEPTTGVDHESQQKFYETLNILNKKKKMTIVLVTHDIGTITKYVNKVACLSGKLVFHGTHENFCSSNIAMKFLTKDQHLLCHHH